MKQKTIKNMKKYSPLIFVLIYGSMITYIFWLIVNQYQSQLRELTKISIQSRAATLLYITITFLVIIVSSKITAKIGIFLGRAIFPRWKWD